MVLSGSDKSPPRNDDIRRRVFAGVAQADERAIVGIDVPQLLQHLLLFDGVTTRSRRDLEQGHLVRLLGLDNASAILNAKGLRIHCDPSSLVRAGEPNIRVSAAGVIRLDRLDYGIIRAGNHAQWVDTGIRDAVAIAGLTSGRAKKFENVVRGHLIKEDPNARESALAEARRDLLSVSLALRASLDVALRNRCNVGIPSIGEYQLEIQHYEGRGYAVETDLAAVLGIPPDLVAVALNEGLLGAVGINSVLDDIRTHNAMVGMQSAEFPVLNEKLSLLARQFDAESHATRLTRVLELVHLPSVTADAATLRVNVRRLLEVRETGECRAFRDWLWTVDSVDDTQIQEQFSSLRTKLGSMIRTGPGKAVRWAIGTGIGLIPVVGNIAGGVMSMLDTFVVEKVLPSRGALSFLGAQYQSIFEEPGNSHETAHGIASTES